jgi:cold shock protein
MSTGTVKFFDETRGYGFIEPDDKSKDVFIHRSSLEAAGMAPSSVVEGTKLSFDVVKDERSGKYAAQNVRAA